MLVNQPTSPPTSSTGDSSSPSSVSPSPIMNVTLISGSKVNQECEHFLPFLSRGAVAHSETSVQILRDTGCAHSLLLKSDLPEWETSVISSNRIIKGIGGVKTVPLVRVYVKSSLVDGYFTVGMEDTIPVDGVDLLMGNDLCGEKVVPDPVVNDVH